MHDLGQRTGINPGHLSRIENGKRPPTETLAAACDRVFPERKGWFREYYEELRTWSEVPAWFRNWPEYEDSAATLRVWCPGIVHGLLQTEDYARALLATAPGVSSEAIATRLTSRMDRQRRVLMREESPAAWFVIDEMALYRRVGSAEIMADQMRHLAEVAAMPGVTMQVLPAIAHPATASEVIITDDAAWCEHLTSGYVFTGEAVSSLGRLFDTLRSESRPASESAALIERTAGAWASGASRLTLVPTADHA